MGRRGLRVNWQSSACNSTAGSCSCGCGSDFVTPNGMKRIPIKRENGSCKKYRVIYNKK